MLFEIKNRFTGNVQFTAEIDADDNTPLSVKIGLAVRWGYRTGAVLSGANLRGANLRGADLRGAVLSDAYLRGADLRGAVLSGANLRGANLRGANLRGADLRGAVLSDAYLRGAVLSDAYLRGAVLSGANLRGAVLSGANLRGANLRGAVLRGVPKIPNIHQAVYTAASAPGALEMGDWHTCETTHCRAGWVVTLAGDAGKAMEYCMGPAAAAALIYLASDPKLEKIPDFYATNEDALADMKRLAEQEAAS